MVLLAVLALSACGGHSKHTIAHRALTVAPTSAAAPGCSPVDETMGCVLAEVPAPSGITPRAVVSTYGIDFAWSGVSAARAKAIGARFGASYLSTDPSKNWTAASVAAYHAAGLATVAVWETYANRAQAGFAAGVTDAQSARAQAAALGNTNRPIDFAVDCACVPSSVLGYFQGVHSILGSRANAYGDYAVIGYLHQHGVVGPENWQTYAWSGGLWLPASVAPLEQYLNGSAFDNDRGLASRYGQWPAPAVVHPARQLPVCFNRRESAAACAAAKAKVASDLRAVAASNRALAPVTADLRAHACIRPYRRGVCVRDGRSAAVFAQRVRWFSAAALRVQAAN